MRVALFITCFNDTLFPGVGIATTHLLERLGLTVDFPEAQTCCGQMHFNTGYQRESIPLLQHFVEVFRGAEVVVAPSASCVGMVRELYPRAAALSWTWPEKMESPKLEISSSVTGLLVQNPPDWSCPVFAQSEKLEAQRVLLFKRHRALLS